jgi:hypothetical protein
LTKALISKRLRSTSRGREQWIQSIQGNSLLHFALIRFSSFSEQQKQAKEKSSNVKSMDAPKKKNSEDGRIDTKAVYDDSQNKAKLTRAEYKTELLAEVEKQILKLAGIKKGSPNEKFV